MRVQKAWGEEIWIANTPLYCGKILVLNSGWQCSLHHHKIKDETFYVLDGLVLMEINGEPRTMRPGDSVHVPAGTKHRFGGLDASRILEVSTQHDDADVYRDEPSRLMNQ